MRISDWSSDVCSSNLSARPCATAYTTSPSSWALPPSSPCAALVRSSAPPMATSAARRADDEPLGEPMDAACALPYPALGTGEDHRGAEPPTSLPALGHADGAHTPPYPRTAVPFLGGGRPARTHGQTAQRQR